MTEEQESGSKIIDEFETLGKQLVSAFKTMWDSEESRKLRQEIRDGFVELGRQVDEAVKTAQDSEAAKEFKEQVKETVDKARESDVVVKVEEGMVTGLRKLNEEVSKFVGSLDADKAQGAETAEEPPAEPEA